MLVYPFMLWLTLVTTAAATPRRSRTLQQQLPPQLNGQHFQITTVQEGSFLSVQRQNDKTKHFSGYLIDMLEALSRPDRANFTYELKSPSGYGSLCSPQLNSSFSNKAFDEAYQTQYNCGASDVHDLPLTNTSTDMYLGLFYITPSRQLLNQFTIPYQPPTEGTLAMYGTATNIRDFDDLVVMQQTQKQPPACAPGGTALIQFVQDAFPGLQVQPIFASSQADIDQAFEDGTCQVYIIDAPLVNQMVLQKFLEDDCTVHGKPYGLIGEPMSFGLSQYGIGIRQDLDSSVVHTLSYWMNVLMSCNPLDPSGQCPSGNFATFYQGRGGTGSECGYIQFPSVSESNMSGGAIAGIVVAAVVLVAMGYTVWHCYKIKRHNIHLKQVKERVTMLETYKQRLKLLDKVAEVQRQYLQSKNSRMVHGCLLEGILELTDSEYGFIGEVQLTDEEGGEGTPHLLVHASFFNGWEPTTVRLVPNDSFVGESHKRSSFLNLDVLFGEVFSSKQPVVSNNRNNTIASSSKQEHVVVVSNFLGIPFFHQNGEMGGMVVICNKPGGYTQTDVDFLAPFSATGQNVIQAYRQIETNEILINTLEEKVNERTKKLERTNDELAKANRRVLQASAAQLKHFACMSHEIRTPLNCIIGMSSLLQATELNPSQEESVGMIVTSGDLLLTVVNDVLDYSKLESGNVAITIKECNLQDTLNAVVHSIEAKSQGKHLVVQTIYDCALPEFVRTDCRRVQQILYNLLGNAIKFSKDNGVLELAVTIATNDNNNKSESLVQRGSERDGPMLHFVVKDYGIGIEKGDFASIFKPFSQATSETESAYGGTGLGLAITSKLVGALGGTVSVDSVVGEWTAFTVELPFRDSPVDVALMSNRLRGIHVSFVTRDEQHVEYIAGIFQTYSVDFTHSRSMADIGVESLIEKVLLSKDKSFVLLVQEDLFDDLVFERIKGAVPCCLQTYGPNFAIDKSKQHYRDLVRILPSVLLRKLGHINGSTTKEQQQVNGNGARGRTPSFERNMDGSFSSIRDNDAIHNEMMNTSSRGLRTPNFERKSSFSSLRVLIAEDNKVNQKVLTRLLQKVGVDDIAIVDNGRKAVEWEEKHEVDIVLMDYQMPEMDGPQACKIIVEKKDRGHSAPIVVFVTAHATDGFENKCYEAGCSGFLTKPFSIRALEACLEDVFS